MESNIVDYTEEKEKARKNALKPDEVRPLISEVEGEEEDFRNWIVSEDEKDNSISTFKTYWNNIRKHPHFDILTEPDYDIDGLISTYTESGSERTHLRQYIKFQFQRRRDFIEEEADIDELEQYFDKDLTTRTRAISLFKKKKNEILELIESEGSNDQDEGPDVKYHYIYKEDLVELLRKAPPIRAKFWATLYLLGARWGEVKRLKPEHRLPDYNDDHGAYQIEKNRTKSKKAHKKVLYTGLVPKILEDVPIGDWVDPETDEEWESVYFPDRNNSDENYQLGKEVNGKVYGLAGEIGMEPRTLHSFRHTRITDLLKAEGRPLSEVQDRSGHEDSKTTNDYKEVNLKKQPTSLEQYCEKHDIDLMEVINAAEDNN
ncbi:tyrosine-type recombinase/integrase [Natrinema sp. H-ect4]|uniref:tyrosine-type recombinase/integrase n=1 Tax=Natrinema sp. H-ect4 TaxID=3242699 RepID=UPI0035A954B2